MLRENLTSGQTLGIILTSWELVGHGSTDDHIIECIIVNCTFQYLKPQNVTFSRQFRAFFYWFLPLLGRVADACVTISPHHLYLTALSSSMLWDPLYFEALSALKPSLLWGPPCFEALIAAVKSPCLRSSFLPLPQTQAQHYHPM